MIQREPYIVRPNSSTSFRHSQLEIPCAIHERESVFDFQILAKKKSVFELIIEQLSLSIISFFSLDL